MAADGMELFPHSERVIYDRAPLVQVICQLRFPAILRIASQPPAEFQERIRDVFPLLEKSANVLLAPSGHIPVELAQVFATPGTAYQFHTEDRSATIALETDSMSLTVHKYTRWEQFRDRLRVPLLALTELYSPAFFSRIGLRYINAIQRSKLSLTAPWSQLLRREILAELALPEIESNLKAANRVLVVGLDGGNSLLLRHGLSSIQGSPEIAYTIDFDFFTEGKTEVGDAAATIDKFNKIVGRAFRWCITDTLHNALGPQPISGD